MQLLPGLVIEPSAPWVGWVTIENVSSQVSGSLPGQMTGPEPSSPTDGDLSRSAVGVGVRGGQVIVTVAEGSRRRRRR